MHTQETTCGIDEHSNDCLCDVHVTDPTPIKYGVDDIIELRSVAKYLGLSFPYDANSFGKMLEVASVLIERKHAAVKSKEEFFRELEGDTGDQKRSKYRAYIKKEYATHAVSTVYETMQLLGIDYETLLDSLTWGHRTPEDLPLSELETLVAELSEGVESLRAIARRHGLYSGKGMFLFLSMIYYPKIGDSIEE